MNARLEIKPREVKVGDIAEAAVEQAHGEIVKAARLMEQEVLSDPEKYRALMDPLVADACYKAVANAVRQTRNRVWTAPNYQAAGNGSRVRSLSAGTLLMFPLPGGKPLGEATRDEVLTGADVYRQQADDMHIKAEWLTRIAEKLKDKQVVAKAFTEESLRKLQAEVSHAA